MDKKNRDRLASGIPGGNPEYTGADVDIKPDLEQLRVYTQAKLFLGDQLRVIRQGLKKLGCVEGERQCGDLLVKLAEDRFILGVLGQFKRGKSTLMNAIIGQELLPTGVLPLTSAITVLKYGPSEQLVVVRSDSIFPEELPLSALPDFVTEKGNPDNRRKVKTVTVELPTPFLRYGIEFVDTPGIGSAIAANTATTYDFLPHCDAVLFVTGSDTPMTSLELEFLGEVGEYVSRLFVVVNKIDLVTDDERKEVLGFVTRTINAQTGNETVKLFPVSSRQGLAARRSGDQELYEQSGLKALEEALVSFLSREKSIAFLAAVAHKALRVLDNESTQDIFGEDASAIRVARNNLEELSKGLPDGRIGELTDTDARSSIGGETEPVKSPMIVYTSSGRLPFSLIQAEITEDLQTRTCPVCRHTAKQAFDFFANWQYQLITHQETQVEYAAELGFCPLHTWQLLSISSPYGASVGYARLAQQVALHLKKVDNAPGTGDDVRHLLRDSRDCRVCKLIRQVEGIYVPRLAAMISEVEGRELYRHSQGACLKHLGMLLNIDLSAESREFLISHAIRSFEQDAEDMRSYAIKYDALRRGLQNRDEQDAYRRAIIRIVGERKVCTPWEEDGEI